ncbi:hypothetical protein HK105_202089 [Polyrhizophydium stewartii]|uniref:Uncharacterized protein n=1 Tax=Polyrhizophydium stewartii TaxID=2732419 RepID=A0ABR4NF82_9FUNG
MRFTTAASAIVLASAAACSGATSENAEPKVAANVVERQLGFPGNFPGNFPGDWDRGWGRGGWGRGGWGRGGWGRGGWWGRRPWGGRFKRSDDEYSAEAQMTEDEAMASAEKRSAGEDKAGHLEKRLVPGFGPCGPAIAHFYATGSPTLIQCVQTACAPGQSFAYQQRALYQCYALEAAARRSGGGFLPPIW